MTDAEEMPPDPDRAGSWHVLDDLPVPAVVHELGANGRILFLNTAFTEIFGYRLADIPTTQSWAEKAFPDPRQRRRALEAWSAEIAARRRTGRIAPARPCRLLDSSGRPRDVLSGVSLHAELAVVTLQDVTEFGAGGDAGEAERGRVETIAHALTENMPAGAYTMVLKPGEDAPEFEFLSARFLEMLGLSRATILRDPATVFACLHPEDRPRWWQLHLDAVRKKDRLLGETRIVVAGQTRWVRADSVPRVIEDGTTVWEGVLVDITDLKEAESRLQSVLAAARAYTWRQDLGRRRSEFDKNWVALEGHGPGVRDIASEDWIRSVHPEDATSVRAAVEALEAGDIESDILTYRRRLKDGRWIWVQVHAGISERYADGRPAALSGVTFDITREVERREAELAKQASLREDLQRAQKQETVARMAGSIVHELNNLIGLVQWSLELLDETPVAQRGERLPLGALRRATDMSRDLAARLREISDRDLPRAQGDLRDLLPAALGLLGRARRERHSVRLDLPPVALPVWTNETEFLRVMLDLLIAACESGGGDPESLARVKMTAAAPGALVPARRPDAGVDVPPHAAVSVISIKSTGSGLSPAAQARMFDRDFIPAVIAGPKWEAERSAVAEILQQNRAALWLQRAPDGGADAILAWPAEAMGAAGFARAAENPALVLDTPERDPDLLSGLQALVVDDLPDVAGVISEMLEAYGATVFAESDPSVARKLLALAPEEWSVLVTDLHMPGCGGDELARFARELAPPIPVVLVTARPEMLRQSAADDFASVLAKPVRAAELALAVHRAAGRTGGDGGAA